LTWKAAANDVNSSKSICRDGADVVEDWRVGPVFAEDGLAIWFSLAEGDCPKRSGSLKSEAKSANPTEEVEDAEVFF
jgi:hypothetical protein|tara:strand:+ start:661 stop:891 length:231 start_codon:yes stop_codon:yes gene_type:complete